MAPMDENIFGPFTKKHLPTPNLRKHFYPLFPASSIKNNFENGKFNPLM
jgi:hypothetical protein